MMDRIKYPRTYHLPWSPGATSDDKILKSTAAFQGHDVVVTEKMDGECTTLYHDYQHARSLDSAHHSSRSWIRQYHAGLQDGWPEAIRVCGENLYARHSIAYDALEEFFLGFSAWEASRCLSWDDTIVWFSLLGIKHVPVLYEGIWDEKTISNLHKSLDLTKQEGFVVRRRDSFLIDDFATYVAKWVRNDHVTSDQHWSVNWVPNKRKIDG